MTFVKNSMILALSVGLILSSCKKNKDSGSGDPDPVDPGGGIPTTGTVTEKSADSVYLYCKEAYLWNDLIPAYDVFKPRQYVVGNDTYASADAVLKKIRALQTLDRYSFTTSLAGSDAISSGEDVDLGFFIKASPADYALPIDSVVWYVTYVYNQSPAGVAGVHRGWYINKINGTSIKYDQASVDILNEVFFGQTASANFEFVKPDNSTVTASLAKASFQANSVLFKGTINTTAGKAGYLVFNQFFAEPSRAELATAFAQFQAAGVSDMIVDLRYNPGGSTATQDTLSNFLAPNSANGKKMYTYVYNSTMQAGNNPLNKAYFKRVYGENVDNNTFKEANNTVTFEKAGGLNLNRVVFIVSGSTASASELTINNLRPYMTVKLVGDTTYGKPVGFYPIIVGDAALYPISFKTVNSAGTADYYSGFAPDKVEFDGVDSDWGDTNEPCLASALKYLNTGAFKSATTGKATRSKLDAQVATFKPLQRKLEENKFSGMFDEKRGIRK